MKNLMIFLGGALAGAAATALLTPVDGQSLRDRIKVNLQKRGILPTDAVDEFVEMISAEIDSQADQLEAQ